jgi:hypothetical protein
MMPTMEEDVDELDHLLSENYAELLINFIVTG